MKIELLDNKTVKIVLSHKDMESCQLTYESMDYQNPETKRIIEKLIDKVKKENGVDLSSGKLFIEAFPYADGGCILYVNVISATSTTSEHSGGSRPKAGFDTPLVYSFDNLDSLTKLTLQLNARYGHTILKSTLHQMDDKYYLSLYTYFKQIGSLSRLLGEYGTYCGKGTLFSAALKEHAQTLIPQDAIRTILTYLCR